MFTKLWLQSLCNVTSIGSLFEEKFDGHSLIIFHTKRAVTGFESLKQENNCAISRIFEIDLIYLILQRVHIREIGFREMQTLELSARGWRMYLSIG
jgi:hypothetical protein